MNNQCKNFRKRTKTINKKRTIYLYCTKNKEEIQYSNCKNCPYKEYKEYKKLESKSKIKQKTNTLSKLERNRKSLFTDDLEHCIICGKSPVNLHEIFGGKNRLNSIKYKLVIPLCTCEHHDQVNCRGIHFDKNLREEWHKKGQVKFIETYPDLKFEEIFKKNYL